MSITFEKALGMNTTALKLRAERASVISSNLANMDTPNYKARDINFHDAMKAKMGEGLTQTMRSTHRGHMDFNSNSMGAGHFYRVPTQPSIDGNTVEENTEHAEFMKNSLEFQVAFTLLNSKFKGMRKAIKGDG